MLSWRQNEVARLWTAPWVWVGTLRLCSKRGPEIQLIGLDRDTQALSEAVTNLRAYGDRVRLVRGEFAELTRAADAGWRLGSRRQSWPIWGFVPTAGNRCARLQLPVGGTAGYANGWWGLNRSRRCQRLRGGDIGRNLQSVRRGTASASNSSSDCDTARREADRIDNGASEDRGASQATRLQNSEGADSIRLLVVFQALRIEVNRELCGFSISSSIKRCGCSGTTVAWW